MIGKKNIVFGLLYLVATASLGPYMIKNMFPAAGQAAQQKQKVLGPLQQIRSDGYEKDLDPVKPLVLAKMNTEAILALNQVHNAGSAIDEMKGGPHAHGNLEAVLNILAGLVLMFLAAPKGIKQAISWLFIAGAIFHSGMLYLRSFGVAWAGTLLQAGPWLVLLALLALGIASAIWLKAGVVDDD